MKKYKSITLEQAHELYLLGVKFQTKYGSTGWKVWADDLPTPGPATYSPKEETATVAAEREFRVQIE